VADYLASRGARIAIFDVDGEAAADAASDIGARHGRDTAMSVCVDLTDWAAVEAGVDRVVEQFGGVDILVNNAGVITDPVDVEEMPIEHWDWVVTTNVKSQFLSCRAVVPHMKAAGSGRIINIASRSWLGVPGRVNYSASKGAVVSFTRSLAMELGRSGITANCISPTLVITPLFESTPKDDQELVLKRIRAQPIPRIGTTDDLAYAVAFFADDEASFVTGQHIYVGGGAELMTATP
jgi:3-oxoacyl-[acyl-carrier protein] reductase